MKEKSQENKIIYNKQQTLLAENVIFSAIQGEESDLHKILIHYDRYINRLSSRELYDNYGNIYIYQDPILKTELQNKLVAGVLKFRVGK